MKNTYPLKQLEIQIELVERDGPFSEFKQDVAFVTVKLNNGKVINGVLLLYPNYIISIEGETKLSFSPGNVVKVLQTEEDLKKRSSSNCIFLYNPEEFNNSEKKTYNKSFKTAAQKTRCSGT